MDNKKGHKLAIVLISIISSFISFYLLINKKQIQELSSQFVIIKMIPFVFIFIGIWFAFGKHKFDVYLDKHMIRNK